MRYISVCSGIEAASVAWKPLGWEAIAFAEIEPFPCAVLQHHYPNVPNLGDISKVDWTPYKGMVDVVVGGTPCQDFSVAGKRAGLEGERSALALEYIRLLKEAKPKYFVWENVPGCLSTAKGADFRMLMDAFQDAGYFLDVDILDAQFFGVAQRRRRVFVCGIDKDYLLEKKTITSSIITAKLVLSILQGILEDLSRPLGKEQASWAFRERLGDGLKKKIESLFRRGTNTEGLTSLRSSLDEIFQRLLTEQKKSDVSLGKEAGQEREEGSLPTGITGSQFWPTEESWKSCLEDLSRLETLYTISTGTKTTTQEIIYICSKIALNIAKLIILSKVYYPSLSVMESSDFAAIREFTNYARRTTNSLLGDVSNFTYWNNFIREAAHIDEAVRGFGEQQRQREILPEPEGLPGNTPPRRKTRKENPRGSATCTRTASHWSGGPHPALSQSHNTGGIGMSDQELFSQGGAGLVSGYRMTAFGEYADDDTGSALKARDYKDATDLVCQTRTFRYDDYSQYVEEDLARPCMARDYKGPTDLVCYNNCGFSNYRENNEVSSTLQVQGTECNGGGETLICSQYGDVAGTLSARHDSSPCTDRGQNIVYGVTAKGNGDVFLSEERHTAISACGGMPGQGYPTVFSIAGNVVDREVNQNGCGFKEECSFTLNTIDRHAVAECYSFDSLASNSMKSPNPDSGCRKVEVSKTLDTSNGDPSKNQGGIAVCYPINTMVATRHQRDDGRTCLGIGEDGDPQFTLSSAHEHAVYCNEVAPTIGASVPPYSRPGNERVETEAIVVEPSVTPPITTKWAREGWTAYDETAPLVLKDREGKPGGGKGILIGEDKSFTLSCNQSQAMFHQASVRRLTAKECERLQAFPDDYTNIEFRGKPAPDGARYKALGNSMCVNVMRWIGKRIQMVEDGEI